MRAEAARGFCRSCSAVHRLARTSAAEAQARALMERIRLKGSLDVDSEAPFDPRCAAEQLYTPGRV